MQTELLILQICDFLEMATVSIVCTSRAGVQPLPGVTVIDCHLSSAPACKLLKPPT